MLKTTPLNIKDPEVYRLAKHLSAQTGEPLTAVVKKALQDRLLAQRPSTAERDLMIERLKLISERVAMLPVLDPRTPDEIIGYDEHGVPK